MTGMVDSKIMKQWFRVQSKKIYESIIPSSWLLPLVKARISNRRKLIRIVDLNVDGIVFSTYKVTSEQCPSSLIRASP